MDSLLLEKGFEEFTNLDYLGYAGAMKLPNKEEPKICSVEFNNDKCSDECIDIIISGDGAGSTLINLYSGESSYVLSIPGYNMCHIAIAISLVDYFDDFEVCQEALESAASDYGFERI